MYNCEQAYGGYNQNFPSELSVIQEEGNPREIIIAENVPPVKGIIKGNSFILKNEQIITDIKILRKNKLTIIGSLTND
jgi:hypothetical protein